MNSQTMGPEYLHAESFLVDGVWKEFALTIASVTQPNEIKAADGKLIDKPIIAFEESEKRLILGKVNERLAKYAIGSAKPKDWIGKKITLYAVCGDWFGQPNVAAIRIRIPQGKPLPFIAKKNLGRDITGTRQVTETGEPQ